MANKVYRVGAYVRLSMESTSIESDSVENQTIMLSRFIAMMDGWIETKFYVDDGFSGATFQRPAFQEMIEDVRKGKVNLILVKDLSRFGRNYLEAGAYMEDILPSLGCRFVAIHDGVDTEDGENDIVPFLNAMNDYYIKNHSDRIRSVMAAKAHAGQKVSGHAPYGYRRCEEISTNLVIDEYSAGVVRRIFEMRKEGKGGSLIAQALNAEGILPPRLYYKNHVGSHAYATKAKCWIPSTIMRLLRNETYIGNAVQLQHEIISYRDKRMRMRSVDDWVRLDNVFPAIIDMETWEAVQAVNEEKSIRIPKGEIHLFSGLLRCADCGSNMARNHGRRSYTSRVTGKVANYKPHPAYVCRHYLNTARGECSIHSVAENHLSQVVFEQLKQLIDGVRVSEDVVVSTLTKRLIGEHNLSLAERKKERLALGKRIKKLEAAIATLYESYVTQQSADSAFSQSIQQYEAERLDCENRLATIEASEHEGDLMVGNIQKLAQSARKFLEITEISRSLLESLVEKIVIGEAKIVDGVKKQDITIYYKFIGQANPQFTRG